MMKERLFVMKQFSVRHSLSAMKVGVDAVMLGAWAALPAEGPVLDAGCGCGIISLMLAQRCGGRLLIEGVDMDPLAVIEARQNALQSPWPAKLYFHRKDFGELQGKYSLIISNPPYFNAGITEPLTAREFARHSGSLSPVSLIVHGAGMLAPAGRIAMICPPSWLPELLAEAGRRHLSLTRICRIKGTPTAEVKRIMLEFSVMKELPAEKSAPAIETASAIETSLTIESSPGIFTSEYRELTGEFYLNF